MFSGLDPMLLAWYKTLGPQHGSCKRWGRGNDQASMSTRTGSGNCLPLQLSVLFRPNATRAREGNALKREVCDVWNLAARIQHLPVWNWPVCNIVAHISSAVEQNRRQPHTTARPPRQRLRNREHLRGAMHLKTAADAGSRTGGHAWRFRLQLAGSNHLFPLPFASS